MEQPKLKVQSANVDDLVPYANNAKIHTAEQVDQICASILQFGFNDPVAIWFNAEGEPEIVEGHGRVMAAKKLGISKVPVITLDHLDDEARRAYTHVHNKLTMNTGFDWATLDEELANLDFDFSEFGFNVPNIEDYGIDFELPDRDAPNFKNASLNMTRDQYSLFESVLEEVDRSAVVLTGGNVNADKVCEVLRQWAGR